MFTFTPTLTRSLFVRYLGWLFASVGLCACATDQDKTIEELTLFNEDATDSPLRGLNAEDLKHFDAGDARFEEVFRLADGLGPVYIRHSCASCHADDAKGPGTVMKMVVLAEDGSVAGDQSLLPYGHTVRPQYIGGASQGISAPRGVNLKLSKRFGPAVFGRGYMEAVLDTEIERMEYEQSLRTDGISGRIHRVRYQSEANPGQTYHTHTAQTEGLIGRFGLKARIATVDDFAADAYQGDMGITSPLRPNEHGNPDGLTDDGLLGVDISSDVVNEAADYVRFLEIPERAQENKKGRELFTEVLCATCHTPTLRTREDYPIALLADIDAPVYTDFLLHDMGSLLSDGLSEGDASAQEWRTAPLIGLRHLRNYLHDGRTETLEEAILGHQGPGSEANASVTRFEALSSESKTALLEFVSGL